MFIACLGLFNFTVPPKRTCMLYHVSQPLLLPSRMGNADSIHEAVGLLVHPVHVQLGPLLQAAALGLLPSRLLDGRLVPVQRQGGEASRARGAGSRWTGSARGRDEDAPAGPPGGGAGHQTGPGQGEGGLRARRLRAALARGTPRCSSISARICRPAQSATHRRLRGAAGAMETGARTCPYRGCDSAS